MEFTPAAKVEQLLDAVAVFGPYDRLVGSVFFLWGPHKKFTQTWFSGLLPQDPAADPDTAPSYLTPFTDTLQAFWTGDAWGLDSDSEYSIQGKWQEVVQEKRPYIFYWNDHFELVGRAGAPTYKLYSRIRFDEFDEDGNPIPEFISAEWPCATIAFDIWPAE